MTERYAVGPQLPEGMTTEDLRFVHPERYPLSMAMQGWEVFLGSDIDGNPSKVVYSLKRPIDKGFDIETFRKELRIVDEEGKSLDGYTLSILPGLNSPEMLGFEFIGFPTTKTMDVLMDLEERFSEGPIPERLVKIASSGGKEVTVFDRIKHKLGIR